MKWELNRKGSYIVDDNDKSAVEFSAKEAGDFLISKGMADDLEDLLLFMSWSTSILMTRLAKKCLMITPKDWRKALAECKTAIERCKNCRRGLVLPTPCVSPIPFDPHEKDSPHDEPLLGG